MFKAIAVSIWIVLLISVIVKIAFIQNNYNLGFKVALSYTYNELFKPICSWLISITVYGFALFSSFTDYKLQNNVFLSQNRLIIIILTLLLSLINNFVSVVIIPNNIYLQITLVLAFAFLIHLVSLNTYNIYSLKYIKNFI